MELSKYGTVLMANEVDKCRRYKYGMREEIISVITAIGFGTFSKLLGTMLKVEKSLSERQSGQQHMRSGISGGNQTWVGVSMNRPPRRDR